MHLPIIFIHKNDNLYLPYIFAQAKISNPDSKVFLLGDKRNSYYKFINHDHIDNYMAKSGEFAKIYKHMNTNPYDYEIFCLQRWFVLKEFMEKNNIQQCFHADSDVMIYSDITQVYNKYFMKYDMSMTYSCGHCCYISSIDAITNFCNFIIELYTDPKLFKILEDIYLEHTQNNMLGGVSDMVAFEEYRKRNSDRLGNLSDILDNSAFDTNLNISEGYEMRNGLKNIYLKNNQPYCRYNCDNREIKFNAVHFQGSLIKKYIKRNFTGNIIKLSYYLLLNILNNNLFKELERFARSQRKKIFK